MGLVKFSLILFFFTFHTFSFDTPNYTQSNLLLHNKSTSSNDKNSAEVSASTKNTQDIYIKKTISRSSKIYSFNNTTYISMAEQLLGLSYFDKAFNTDRYYYTEIPEAILSIFNESLNNFDVLTADILIDNLNKYVASSIVDFLNKDSIQETRLEKQVAKSTLSLASTKGKSLDISIVDLERFMNSSFFYIPYLSSSYIEKKIITEKEEKKTDQKQPHLPDNKNKPHHRKTNSIVEPFRNYSGITEKNKQLFTTTAKTYDYANTFDLIFNLIDTLNQEFSSTSDNNKENKKNKKKKISYHLAGGIIWFQLKINSNGSYYFEKLADLPAAVVKSELVDIDAKEKDIIYNLKHLAWDQLTNKLSHKSKLLPAFQIQGPILNSNNHYYDLDINSNFGVELDDYYFAMENFETDKGIISKRVSLLRISKDQSNLSNGIRAIHQFGSSTAMPSWAIEYPRQHIEASLGIASLSHLSCLYYNIQTNLARHLNISQFFLTLDGNINLSDTSSFSSIYLGITKKYWYKGLNINLGTGIGRQFVEYNSVGFFYVESESTSLKLSAGVERLLSPNISLNLHSMYNSTLFYDINFSDFMPMNYMSNSFFIRYYF